MRTTVRQRGNSTDYTVVQDLAPRGAFVIAGAKFASVWFLPEADIAVPAPPKAEPGVCYRSLPGRTVRAVGLDNGKLLIYGGIVNSATTDYSPLYWEKDVPA